MATWKEFARQAPRIAETFVRRHTRTGNLCMLATVRADGSPRISPMEPRFFEDELWVVGMPNTTKYADLARDPRFCLHTATVDTNVEDGDAKLFGQVHDVRDEDMHQRFAADLFEKIGFDLRGREFDVFYAADITGGSSVRVGDGHFNIYVWKEGEEERVVRKH